MSDEECIPIRRTGRGGVQVRVFGGGTVDSNRQERQEFEWADEEVEESVDGNEEVIRLDKGEAPLPIRRIEDEGPKTPVPDRQTKRKREVSLRGLTVLMACLAVLLTVAVVFCVGALGKNPSGPASYLESMAVVETPVEDFDEDLISQSVELFREYSAARTVDEAAGMIREGESLSSTLKQKWQPVGGLESIIVEASRLGDQTIVSVKALLVSGASCEYFIVSGDQGLMLDWEASMGLGEVDFNKLKDLEVGEAVKMRVVVKPATFHPLDFPDEQFRAYKMSDPEGGLDVFGYTRIDSKEAGFLTEALNEGSILLEEVPELAAIVRIENAGRGDIGQFTITDVLTKGWVEP